MQTLVKIHNKRAMYKKNLPWHRSNFEPRHLKKLNELDDYSQTTIQKDGKRWLCKLQHLKLIFLVSVFGCNGHSNWKTCECIQSKLSYCICPSCICLLDGDFPLHIKHQKFIALWNVYQKGIISHWKKDSFNFYCDSETPFFM